MKRIIFFLILGLKLFSQDLTEDLSTDLTEDEFKQYLFAKKIREQIENSSKIKFKKNRKLIVYIKQYNWEKYKARIIDEVYHYDEWENKEYRGFRYLGCYFIISELKWYRLKYGSDEINFYFHIFHIDAESKKKEISVSKILNVITCKKRKENDKYIFSFYESIDIYGFGNKFIFSMIIINQIF